MASRAWTTRSHGCVPSRQAGADVLYAPGVSKIADLRRLLEAVSLPVNVLALPDAPSVAELAELGVARVSVGSGFFLAAMGALAAAGREPPRRGLLPVWDRRARGRGDQRGLRLNGSGGASADDHDRRGRVVDDGVAHGPEQHPCEATRGRVRPTTTSPAPSPARAMARPGVSSITSELT